MISTRDIESIRAAYGGLDVTDLSGANLRGAALKGANISEGTQLDTGETWHEYLSETLPQLLIASERGLEAIAAWGNHSWTDCPMHVAFHISDVEHAPALLRPRIRQFVQLFDAGLVPQPDPAAVLA